jgi:hypothetical protein
VLASGVRSARLDAAVLGEKLQQGLVETVWHSDPIHDRPSA